MWAPNGESSLTTLTRQTGLELEQRNSQCTTIFCLLDCICLLLYNKHQVLKVHVQTVRVSPYIICESCLHVSCFWTERVHIDEKQDNRCQIELRFLIVYTEFRTWRRPWSSWIVPLQALIFNSTSRLTKALNTKSDRRLLWIALDRQRRKFYLKFIHFACRATLVRCSGTWKMESHISAISRN